MQYNNHKHKLLSAAISLALLPLANPSAAQQTQNTVEEITVTGSFIRRSEGFAQASSVTQLNADDLADEGTMNLGEVMQNLSFVGGPSSGITTTVAGTNARSNTIDLRGLGPSSTLTLLDGKRIANDNVNMLIPTIAIQRIDIVADGAAALYGSEAVAGVVNFVPYKSYDGLKVEAYGEQDSRGDYDEHAMQMLWGTEIGVIDVVLAGQFKSNSRLGLDERPGLTQSGQISSSNAPGNWYVPNRNATGQYTGSRTNRPDPNCAPASQRESLKVNQVANPFGMLVGSTATGTCYFDTSDSRSFRDPTDTVSYFGNATWDVNEDLTLSLQGFRSRLYELRYSSTSNPGNSRIGELPTVRGEQPGNPFRAVNSTGQPLFGIDSNGDGLPDRGTLDANKDGLLDYLISGTTNNNVPLWEDVRPRTLRPINKTHTIPDGHSQDYDALSTSRDINTRYTLQADFNVPILNNWKGFAAYSHSNSNYEYMANQNFDISAMQQGLRCDVINDRDACYNPFFVTDQATNNSIHVMNAISARRRANNDNELDTIDIVLNGDIGFELPGGSIGAAVGYQFRDDKFTNTPSETEIAGNTWIGSPFSESVTSGSREVNSYFAEIALPVLENLEVTAALRHESFSTSQKSTDPKFGVTWQATDWMRLRATTGDAFIAPTLTQLLNPVSCGLSPLVDRFSSFSANTTFCAGGNPGLDNESSKSQQLGIDLNFGDLDLSVSWNNTKFDNRIVGISGQQLIQADYDAYREWSGFAGAGTNSASRPPAGQLAAWLASGLANRNIIRDGTDPSTILQVTSPGSVNAEFVEVTSFDIEANYMLDLGEWGRLRANLQATYIDEFLMQDSPDSPVENVTGSTNLITGAAPAVPEWKANLRLGWMLGNHAVTGTAHYLSAMDYDGSLNPIIDSFANTYRRGGITEIHAWADFDLAYTYQGLEVLGGEWAFTLGSRNLFDRAAQHTPASNAVFGETQDPMGRTLYARLVYDF